MKDREPRLYLGNQYPNLYSPRGLRILEEQGFVLGGNILGDPYQRDLVEFKPDIVIFSPTPEDETTGIWHEIDQKKYPFIIFSHFLDRDTGWNEQEGYRYKKHPHFLEPLNSSQRIGPVFAASRFGTKLLTKTYELEAHEVDFNYIGIDFTGIRKTVTGSTRSSSEISVLWDHMWRDNKGFAQALDIINDLSNRYPNVIFTINQLESWRGSDVVIRQLKEKYEHFKQLTKDRNNIVFHPRFSSREEYYQFLTCHDISFCLAQIENFGAGMMEQSAAGIATSVPETGCYPEQYTQYVYPIDEVGHFVESLIQDPDLVAQVANQRLRVASSFDVANHLPFFAQFLHSLLNTPSSKKPYGT